MPSKGNSVSSQDSNRLQRVGCGSDMSKFLQISNKLYSRYTLLELYKTNCCCCEVTLVMSDSVRPQRRQPTRLCRPWASPGKNTGVGCHFLLQCMKVKSEREVAQLCPTLSNPMDCSPPDFSIHGIFQAKVLEWGAIAFSDKTNQMYGNNFMWYLLISLQHLPPKTKLQA